MPNVAIVKIICANGENSFPVQTTEELETLTKKIRQIRHELHYRISIPENRIKT